MSDLKKEEGRENFLIQEYQYYAESFWRCEESGEKKFNFMITLVTTLLAGLIVLLTTDFIDEALVSLFSITVLFSLLLFGTLTFQRILKRNLDTDKYKIRLDKIRIYFKERIAPESLEHYKIHHKYKPRKILTGGLADAMIALNSVIVATLFAILTISFSILILLISSILGFLVFFYLQIYHMLKKYYDDYEDNVERPIKQDYHANLKIFKISMYSFIFFIIVLICSAIIRQLYIDFYFVFEVSLIILSLLIMLISITGTLSSIANYNKYRKSNINHE